ncbi:hypothetical protein [Nonomuraea sp. NPDC049646]|uniref:hypothetical protein n=1 Tax=unclassified Nonomuraea TaxID=2593643 RepID=UPI0037AF0CC0
MDRLQGRAAALDAATRLHTALGLVLCPGVDRDVTARQAETAIRRTADTFAAWLAGTTRIRLHPGPPVPEQANNTVESSLEETMQMNTGQKFSVECDTEDAAGFDTVETIAWSISDPNVAALTVSDDTRTCTVVSGAPGSAVLTASIESLGLSATLAVDVVPAGTATIELVPGDVVDE